MRRSPLALTNRTRRFVVACLDSPGPRHDDPAPVRRGSHAAGLSEFPAIEFTIWRERDRQRQSPTAHESGDGVPGCASANRGCDAERTSRAPLRAPADMRGCAALGASRGAAARLDQGRVVRHPRGDLACAIDARRRAAQLRHLDVRGRVLREPGRGRVEGARAQTLARTVVLAAALAGHV